MITRFENQKLKRPSIQFFPTGTEKGVYAKYSKQTANLLAEQKIFLYNGSDLENDIRKMNVR